MILAEGEPRSEREPQPRVLVEFYGYNHTSINIQAVPEIIERLRYLADLSPGRIVVYMESRNFTGTAAEKWQKMVQKRGLQETIIYSLLVREGRQPDDEKIKRRIGQIAATDISLLAGNGLLPLSELQNYFLAHELDVLGEEYKIEYETESNSLDTIGRSEKQYDMADSCDDEAHRYWADSDFDRSLEASRRMLMPLLRASELREPDIIDDLKRKARTLSREAKGGVLFIIFGNAHFPIVDILQRKLGNNSPVNCQTNWASKENLPNKIVLESLRNGSPIDDETLARYLLIRIVTAEIEKRAGKSGDNLSLVAHSFETILTYIGRIVSKMTFAEIRNLCENKTDVLDFIRSHSQSGPIKSLMPKVTEDMEGD